MARRKETEDQLRARILSSMRADIGISEAMAQPFVESVMRCFSGERPYFPATVREYPIALIKASLEGGVSVKKVMQDFEISRAKLHELFPGGLPGRSKRTLSTTLTKMETT